MSEKANDSIIIQRRVTLFGCGYAALGYIEDKIIRIAFTNDKKPCINGEDNDPQSEVSYSSHLAIVTFKWVYLEETEDFDERVSLFIEGRDLFNFCSDSLQWEKPSQYPKTVSSWTPQHLYFCRMGLWWFLDLCDANGYDIAEEANSIILSINFDCQTKHPFLKLKKGKWLFCGRGKRSAGEVRSYQIRLYSLSAERPNIPILNRFPENYKAALCITDHADYDQVDPLKAVFWGNSKNSLPDRCGLFKKGIRITKSIFARSFPGYTGIGVLDDCEFKTLINSLHDEGHEIVPHGIRSFPGTTEELAKDFKEAFHTFKPKTWIDHLYSYSTLLPHSLANEGLEPSSSSYIWPLLQNEGIDLFWSGIDIHHNPPAGKINAFDLTDNYPSSYLIRTFKSLFSANLKEGCYYGVEFIDSLLGIEKRYRLGKAIQLILSKKNTNRVVRDIGKIAFEISISFVQAKYKQKAQYWRNVQLFSMQNRFTQDATIGTFSTIRLNSLGKGLSPDKWKKVYQDRGVVLLHTYLSCNHPLGDNAWEKVGNQCKITPSFDKATEFLSEEVRQKRLWNPTVHEMWEWYKEWKMVRLVPDVKTGEWKIINPPKKNIGFVNNCSLDRINRTY